MSLIAGSYEKFIWGYKLRQSNPTSSDQTLTLNPQFSYAAHLSPIKSVAVSGVVAASSAGDDTVKLYDLATSSELGSLLLETSVTSLSFFTPPSLSSFPRNLFAAADDGSFSIFDVDPFVLLKTIQVHKKGINDLCVHPSGKLGLSVGRDSCLAMVNLVRGRRSFICRLEKEANIVEYCSGGGRFFMVSDGKISLHEAEDAKIVGEFESAKRVLCAAPGENGLIFTGGEDRALTAWDTVSGKVAYSIEDAHKSRVKGIVVLSRDGNSGATENPYLLASASSDGVIRVWDVRATNKEKSKPLSEANTKSRLTCLAGSLKIFEKITVDKRFS
ncbi:p21-activated protein kinase-interacting protein 1-like [Chenopodium quinoa]|uniref:p21-activated protein kinase-interacting protein 1-like n=1 Tax=Chenopodium quinoa TaxID=63459 RepID=UPI000B778933|nr:p21-activated protein kinase-interacting protein 1-like [Chenopodium quinoa]